MRADDPLDTINGTTAIGGAADSILVLTRRRGENSGSMLVTGRDIPEREFAVKLDPQSLSWSITEATPTSVISAARREIIDVIREQGKPLTSGEIAHLLDRDPNGVRVLVHRMKKVGHIRESEDGRYILDSQEDCANYH
jgi:hypothetical protein